MCTTCGCSGQTITHDHDHQHDHSLDLEHTKVHPTDKRLIEVEQDLLSKNNRYAENNRQQLKVTHTTCFNLVSSPGSGKTSLLVSTINALKSDHTISVIEGDQQTDNDAQRIKETGAQATQINTGKGCHLDAHAVGHALEHVNLDNSDFVFIENVGNLVCPAAFDLGELCKVVILSVTEGEDKPLKYPDMFRASDLMILNKSDLLPYLDFDVEKCIEYARRINPKIEVIQLSATRSDTTDHEGDNGLVQWIDWLKKRREASFA